MPGVTRLAVAPPDQFSVEDLGHGFFVQIAQNHNVATQSGLWHLWLQKRVCVTPENIR
jgi:hypothetical protein